MKEYIMTIDEGTTSTRAIIFDHSGNKVADAQQPISQYFPHAGWVEQNANEIWDAVLSTISNALVESNIQPDQIKGIGIANQRETTIIWDKKTGLPIYNAIVWQSRQTSDIAQRLIDEGYTEMIHQKTGLTIDAYFSATKIRWILDHIPGAQQRAENGELLFGTINTWLLWKMTGGQVHATDYTNASRTMLFNINDLKWDDDILELLNIPKKILPALTGNSEVYGYTQKSYFHNSSVPIASMIGDQQGSLFGQLALHKGMMKNTYGTGAFIVMNTGTKPMFSRHKLLTTIGYAINGQINYALEGSVFIAGAAVQWLHEQMKLLRSNSESEQAAFRSHNADEVYIVPAFTGLGAPYWDSNTRGAIFGLTRGTTSDDLVKATLQAIAYQTKDVIETMEDDTNIKMPILRVDGAAAQNKYLMQFQADILDTPVERTANLETTSLGAAFLAGLSVGYWKNLDEIKAVLQIGDRFDPQMSDDKRKRLYRGWHKAVHAARVFANGDD
ncbi:MAG: glycerol kinase GlpK [Candidatus Paralactobacillus gallistercoris]|uniref:Glycerol kinase n=1 Tax=Candidatus Paralactobacillus gallistercoris TaxID=2838724 RepID=A0A948TJ06_9LACO|nr:glycerol kinase GlpK [Candidatus Paralactobacillus gallistercoris]